MTLYRKLIRPMHCYPGHNYEPLTEPVEKEEKWYPEEEREFLEKKYASYNEGSFSDLVFEEKYEPLEQEAEVCENCPYKLEDIGDFSDGYHTFNDLYTQRAVLFATIVNQNLDKAWKSRKHEDGEPCFGGGWFIVGIDTPDGSYTYHYEDKYWDIYKCIELPVAKHWDGHTDKDVWRLLTLDGR